LLQRSAEWELSYCCVCRKVYHSSSSSLTCNDVIRKNAMRSVKMQSVKKHPFYHTEAVLDGSVGRFPDVKMTSGYFKNENKSYARE